VSNNPPKIYIAGHRGMVGSAIVRRLQAGCERQPRNSSLPPAFSGFGSPFTPTPHSPKVALNKGKKGTLPFNFP